MKQLPYIYKITNILTGQSYIGQHDGHDKNYYASGYYIRNAIKKYGKENFRREIIIEGDFSKEQLDELEIFYIEKYKTFIGKYPTLGYNLTLGGNGTRGAKVSEETKQIIRLVNSRPILQYSQEGVFIQEFSSITEASQRTGISHPTISSCVVGKTKRKLAGKFQWRYKTKNYPIQIESVSNQTERTSLANSVGVLQYSLEGIFIQEFPSITEASLRTGVERTSISSCCRGRTSKSGDYQWKYKTENYPQRIKCVKIYNKIKPKLTLIC